MPDTVNWGAYCVPNWVDQPATSIVAGGETANKPASNVQNKLMGRFWRTPGLHPRFTQITLDYSEARPSSALLVGNINLPETGSLWRVRKGASVADEWIHPANVAFLSSSNASGAPIDLDDADPYAPDSNWVEPVDPDEPMSFRLALDAPPTALKAGDFLQTIQVAYSYVVSGLAGPTIEVNLYQAGLFQEISVSADAFPAGEVDVWVLELRFNASALEDPTGANLQVQVNTAPGGGEAIKVGAIRQLSTCVGTDLDYDSGYVPLFPVSGVTEWVALFPDVAGKPVQKDVALPFLSGAGVPISVVSRYTRIEFLLSESGPWEFTDSFNPDQNITWMDVGRIAEGPGLGNMHLGSGFKLGLVDLSTHDQSDGGVQWEDQEATYVTLSIRLNELTKDQALNDLFGYAFRHLGTTEDFLLIIFPQIGIFSRYAFTWGPFERIGEIDQDHGVVFRSSISTRQRL